MRLTYRQGLVAAPTGSLQLNSNTNAVDIVIGSSNQAGLPVLATAAGGPADYLIAEYASVTGAWGPFTGSTTQYLYWQINPVNGAIVRGSTPATVNPTGFTSSATAPPSPVAGQFWWNTTLNQMNAYNGLIWEPTLLVFMGSITNGSTLILEPFTSQVGLTGLQVNAGYVFTDGYGGVFRDNAGNLLTTETPLISNDTGSLVKLDGALVVVQAGANIPAFTLVYLLNGRAVAASSDPSVYEVQAPIAMVVDSVAQNGAVSLATAGRMVVNQAWSWAVTLWGSPVYCDTSGNVTLTKPSTTKYVRVGTIIGAQNILLSFDWETDATQASGGAGAGVEQVLATAPLTIGGSSTFPVVSIPQVTTTNDGYLDAADYATFLGYASSIATKVSSSYSGWTISQVVGLQAQLNTFVTSSYSAWPQSSVVGLTSALAGLAPTTYTNWPISSVVGLQTQLNTINTSLNSKVGIISGAVTGNIPTFANSGTALADSGVALSSITGKVDKVPTATVGNFSAFSAGGDIADSGYNSGSFALSGPTTTQFTNIATQISAINTTLTSKADKVSSPTNGDFASLNSSGDLVDSGYSATSFASASATSASITSLTNGLISTNATIYNKVDKIPGATAGNFPSFLTGGDVADSGYNASSFILASAMIPQTQITGLTSSLAAKVNKAGDTMTGLLVVPTLNVIGSGSQATPALLIDSTGEFQLLGSPGTAGQVLTSGGPGQPTSWTTVSSSGGSSTTITVAAQSTGTYYPTFVSSTSGSQNLYAANQGTSPFSYNAATNTLSAANFAGSLQGNASSATNATTATKLAGGAAGSLPYQSTAGSTAFLAAGTNGQVLTLSGGIPAWEAPTGGATAAGSTGQIQFNNSGVFAASPDFVWNNTTTTLTLGQTAFNAETNSHINPLYYYLPGSGVSTILDAQYSVTAGNGDSTYYPPGRYNGYATAPANTAYAGVTGNSQAYGSFTTTSNAANFSTPAMLIVDADGGPVFLWPTGTAPSWDFVVITNDAGSITLQRTNGVTTNPSGFTGWFYTNITSVPCPWTVGNTYTVTFYSNNFDSGDIITQANSGATATVHSSGTGFLDVYGINGTPDSSSVWSKPSSGGTGGPFTITAAQSAGNSALGFPYVGYYGSTVGLPALEGYNQGLLGTLTGNGVIDGLPVRAVVVGYFGTNNLIDVWLEGIATNSSFILQFTDDSGNVTILNSSTGGFGGAPAFIDVYVDSNNTLVTQFEFNISDGSAIMSAGNTYTFSIAGVAPATLTPTAAPSQSNGTITSSIGSSPVAGQYYELTFTSSTTYTVYSSATSAYIASGTVGVPYITPSATWTVDSGSVPFQVGDVGTVQISNLIVPANITDTSTGNTITDISSGFNIIGQASGQAAECTVSGGYGVQAGGALVLAGGPAEGFGGSVTVQGGLSNNGNGGNAVVTGGQGGGTFGNGGNLFVQGGNATGVSANAGSVNINAGINYGQSGNQQGSIIFTTAATGSYGYGYQATRFTIDPWGTFIIGTDPGTAGQVLTSAGPQSPPSWTTVSASSATSPDPFFGNVAMLLHFQGANTSQSWIDSSIYTDQRSFASSNVYISTAQSPFGGSSAYFDPAGNGTAHIQANLSGGDMADISIGQGSFTIEYWIYFNNPNNGIHFSVNDGGNCIFRVQSNSNGAITLQNFSGNNAGVQGTTPIAADTWTHVAVTRYGNLFALFVDGIFQGAGNLQGSVFGPMAGPILIGGWPLSINGIQNNGLTDAYMSDFRITRGVARYVKSFTPPTAYFPDATTSGIVIQPVGDNGQSEAGGSNSQIQFNSGGILSGTSSLTWSNSSQTLSTDNLAITGSISANGSVGTTGQVLTSNNSGVAYWAAPAGGGPQLVITGIAYLANVNDKIIADTTNGAFTITLPPAPSQGNTVYFIDGGGTWGTNNLTIDGNGKNIMGITADMIVNQSNDNFSLIYYNAQRGWILGE